MFERKSSFLDRLRKKRNEGDGPHVMKIKTKSGHIKEVNSNGVEILKNESHYKENSRKHRQVQEERRLLKYFQFAHHPFFIIFILDLRKFRVPESSRKGNIWEGDPVPREVFQPPVRHQDSEEGGHHQEGRGGAHHDRKQGPSVHQTSFPNSKSQEPLPSHCNHSMFRV